MKTHTNKHTTCITTPLIILLSYHCTLLLEQPPVKQSTHLLNLTLNMKLSLSSLAAIAIVGIAASTLPNAAGHLRSIPPPSLVEDNAHSYDKGATAPLTKGTEEVNHNREGRKLPRKKKKSKKKVREQDMS